MSHSAPVPGRLAPADRAAILGDIATCLLEHDQVTGIVDEVFAQLSSRVAIDLLFGFVLDDDGHSLRLAGHADVDAAAAAPPAHVESEDSLCGAVARRRTRLVIEGVQDCRDPRAAYVHALGVRAYVCYPLIGRRGLVGTLSFGSRTRDTFAEEEIELLQAVANQAAVALERARALEALNHEIEERRQTENALREREAELQHERRFLRTVIDSVSSAIVVKDRAGRCILANEPAARVLGMTPETLVGQRDVDYMPAAMYAQTSAEDRAVIDTQKEVTSEVEVPGADGAIHSFIAHKTPLVNADGSCDRVLITAADITWRKRAEQALRASERRLKTVVDELREADERKNEFIAVLSHELRNPIAPIRYALPVLQAESLGASGSRALRVIERQLAHLTRLVDDLLDVSRITRGKIELRLETVALASVITTAAEAASPQVIAARHGFDVRVPDEPIWVRADAARLAQVVTNLLNNAARYTPRGGRIVVTAGRDNGHAVISVRDNGIGIPGDAISGIFDMFRQGERPDPRQGGLGIGLALSRRLVEMHQGTIEAHSGGAGQGAEFVVRLPLSGAEAVVEPADTACSQPDRCDRMRVLVVDDNADLVEMLAIVVEGLGHEVRKALDGRSAISAAAAFRPDVVLLDLGLPILTGVEVARHLRGRPETARTTLIALTGWGQAEDLRRTREAGFDHHLTKPADPDQVERLLRQVTADRHR